jgi:hypothetical protein
MATHEEVMERADAFVVHVEAFIATLKFPSDEARRASVAVVIDGADEGGRAIYDAIRAAAPQGSNFGAPGPIPTDKISTAVIPYLRLKEIAAKCGYVLGPQQDAPPGPNEIRVASFTEGAVKVAKWQLLVPKPGDA